MVVETIHVMDAEETTSEAVKNYAEAAWLLGMTVLVVGMGVGIITQSIKNLRKQKSSSLPEDLVAELRKRTSVRKAEDLVDVAKDATVEGLRRAVEDILGSHGSAVLDQVKLIHPKTYYVKKSYKEPVKVGSLIPETYLVEKPETMDSETFMRMDNLKFKSKTITHIKDGINLVTVDEILNSAPVKPV